MSQSTNGDLSDVPTLKDGDTLHVEYTLEGDGGITINAWEVERARLLPKPIRQHRRIGMLGCLVYLVSIVASLYLIGQAIRYAIGG